MVTLEDFKFVYNLDIIIIIVINSSKQLLLLVSKYHFSSLGHFFHARFASSGQLEKLVNLLVVDHNSYQFQNLASPWSYLIVEIQCKVGGEGEKETCYYYYYNCES